MAALALRPRTQQQREEPREEEKRASSSRHSSSSDGFVTAFPRHNGAGRFQAEAEEDGEYLDVGRESSLGTGSPLTIDETLSWPASSSQRSPISERASIYPNERSPSISQRSLSRGSLADHRLTASALSRVSSRVQLQPRSNSLPSNGNNDDESMADSIEFGLSLAPQAISAGIRPLTRRRYRQRYAPSVKSALSGNALHILVEDESDKENEDEGRGRKRRHRLDGRSDKESKRSHTSGSAVGDQTAVKPLGATAELRRQSYSGLLRHRSSDDLKEYPSALYSLSPGISDGQTRTHLSNIDTTNMRRTRSESIAEDLRDQNSPSTIVQGIQTALTYWREVLRLLASSPI